MLTPLLRYPPPLDPELMEDDMSISDMMKALGVERIVFVPACDLVPHDRFHAWPLDGGGLTNVCGRGNTVEEAIRDMAHRTHREAA